MKTNLDDFSMVAVDNLLYTIGGEPLQKERHLHDEDSSRTIRVLDHRSSSKWQELSARSFGSYSSSNTCSCAHNTKIYVCKDAKLEVYDTVAGKWVKLRSLAEQQETYQLISFENWLWAIGKSHAGLELIVQTYDPSTGNWISVPSLRKINSAETRDGTYFESAVIFKTLDM